MRVKVTVCRPGDYCHNPKPAKEIFSKKRKDLMELLDVASELRDIIKEHFDEVYELLEAGYPAKKIKHYLETLSDSDCAHECEGKPPKVSKIEEVFIPCSREEFVNVKGTHETISTELVTAILTKNLAGKIIAKAIISDKAEYFILRKKVS